MNPTDTARALVTNLEQLSALKLGDEIVYGVNSPEAFQRKAQIDNARAALLAHVAGETKDAERWRALFAKGGRVRVLGWSGLWHNGPHKHIGIELWNQYPQSDLDVNADKESRETLTTYADQVSALATRPTEARDDG